jgi:hypothetical protein
MVRSVIEILYRGGDVKLKYNTKNRKQVLQVITKLKETKLGSTNKSVYEQIRTGERHLCGVTSSQETDVFKITEGIVPPEEQVVDFLTNERYVRRPVLVAVMGG